MEVEADHQQQQAGPLLKDNQLSTTISPPYLFPMFDLPRSLGYGLVIGPPQSGKTTVAFNLSREIALFALSNHISGDVWYICSKSKIDNYSAISLVSKHTQMSVFGEGDEMDRIQMKYMQTLSDLNWWSLRVQELFQTNNIPNHSLFPIAIIVDDFDVMLEAEEFSSVDKLQRSVLHTVTLLKLVIEFLNSKTNSHHSLVLCMNTISKWYIDVKMILARGFNNNIICTSRNTLTGSESEFYLNEHKVSESYLQTTTTTSLSSTK